MTATQTAVTATERPRLTRRQMILAALAAFIRSRPGLEFANYGDVTAYRSEQRSIARAKRDAETLLSAVNWRDGIDADALLRAARSSFSGRLSITERDDGRVAIDYCAGQYYPTEYRNAACAVLASALWEYTREKACPEGDRVRTNARGETEYLSHGKWMRPGAWLRDYFRREFGVTMQRRWFD